MTSNSESVSNDARLNGLAGITLLRNKWSLAALLVAAIVVLGFYRQTIFELAAPVLSLTIVDAAIDRLTGITLVASAGLLQFLGFDVYTIPETRELGMEDFHVYVWGPCSGIEGFGLITLFLSVYMWMFKDRLRFPAAFMLVPIGIALSWCLNVVRISTLLVIGARVSPELALDTFHSHAGWLMFTVLAVSLAGATSAFGWFHKTARVPAGSNVAAGSNQTGQPSFFADPNIAAILPFIVFMASAFLLQTFTLTPQLYYPLRVVAMVGVLWLIWPYLRTLNWRPSMVPVIAGLGIGVVWVATASPTTEEAGEIGTMLAGLSVFGGVSWILARTLGTVLLVPIIEEIFFRGYLLRKVDTGSMLMRIVAILVSSTAFAVLHGRWLAAFLAGVVFAIILLRRGRVSDAIYAHASANGLIAAYAILMQDWSVI